MTVIAENPFPECDMLTDINVSDSHPTLAVVDGVLFSKTEKRLLCYPYAFTAESYAIPQGIQIISQEAFLSSSLKNISIPDSVVNIDNLAFGMCENLTSVDLPDSVTRIGEVAFFRCEALTEVVIPASTVVIEDYAFDSCPNLTLTVEAGSYAEQYAVDNELTYEYAQDLSWLND